MSKLSSLIFFYIFICYASISSHAQKCFIEYDTLTFCQFKIEKTGYYAPAYFSCFLNDDTLFNYNFNFKGIESQVKKIASVTNYYPDGMPIDFFDIAYPCDFMEDTLRHYNVIQNRDNIKASLDNSYSVKIELVKNKNNYINITYRKVSGVFLYMKREDSYLGPHEDYKVDYICIPITELRSHEIDNFFNRWEVLYSFPSGLSQSITKWR